MLSGGLHETNTIVSGGDHVFLVEEHEVDGGPDGDKGDADDGEEAASVEQGSAGLGILGEEDDSESRSNNEACSEEYTNEHVPPVDIVVKELIEDLQENEEGNSNDEGADEEHTASNWEE